MSTPYFTVGFIADAAIKVAQSKEQRVPQSSLILAEIAIAYFLFIALQT